ncbi:hypothetical protein L226DRAFT_479395 [Lentinus tigrinus ALCF2SS1-7]|uniref:F-box domain-containing protein n=1 Tax=Lentinus tigrinus ALCF2SS1-6 TaxID=1328759 RepID=A0A5C2SU09_9APHY|nr:hypothetical protein L227DRAFT_149723 [Lentinus tigrinus ALCF2SS1-6]RPD80537.1 hypothetical protein L226DRAFT_479395 [Lentinus tigrinus ALCF2SS1-7]
MLSPPGGPLTLIALPVEVLENIIAHLSPEEAISLSYTCKTIHLVSLDPALHTVVLDRNPEQIKKFRDHLLSTTSRPGYLKSLVLAKAVTWEIERDTPEPAIALADILEKAVRLQCFDCGSMEVINHASDERVAKALVALKDLQEVNVKGGGTQTMNAVLSMNSLGLQILSISLEFAPEMAYITLFEPLARYVHLHTLSISKIWKRLRVPLQPQNTISIPSVRTLTIEDTTICLSLVASIFPNVERVSYQSGRYQRNRLVGPGLTDPSEPIPPCWTHTLARAHLDVADIDIWPLSCRVNWLDFGLLRTGHSREALFLVGRTKPRVLSCAYRIDADNLLWVNLPTVANDLRFLDARIIELSGHRKKYMLMHLSGLDALIAVFLSIRAFYQPEDLDAELTSIVRSLARDNRQLRFVGLSLVDGRSMRDEEPVWKEERLASRWWAIERVDLQDQHAELDLDAFLECGNARLVPITTEVGLKIRDYMYEADYDSPDWQERLSTMMTV